MLQSAKLILTHGFKSIIASHTLQSQLSTAFFFFYWRFILSYDYDTLFQQFETITRENTRNGNM